RGLPRPRGRKARVASSGSAAEPAVLDSLGAGRQTGGAMSRLPVLAVIAAALLAPAAAAAHPLGNFTINRFSRIEAAEHRAYVFYVLDMAEIPTYQAGRIDARAYARRIAAGAE